MNIIGVRWFSGRECVGVVRVEDQYAPHIKYYIGVGLGRVEEADAQHIAEWGSHFPSDAGDVLFGVSNA